MKVSRRELRSSGLLRSE